MRRGTRQTWWTDRDGTEWTLLAMPPIRDLPQRLGFRSRTYAFVVILRDTGDDTELEDVDLQAYVDRALGRTDDGPPTARLWIDPRSRTEWEVTTDSGQIVFRRGTDVIRTPGSEDAAHPRQMSAADLQDALDRAQEGDG